MRTWTVYMLLNTVNGKVYIAQTVRDVLVRWRSHCRLDSKCLEISRAIQKYGPESFRIFEIDKAGSQEDANRLEKEFVELHRSDSDEFGYNITVGGDSKARRFCRRGHDMDSTGRTKGNSCRLCSNERSKAWRAQHPELFRASKAASESRPESKVRQTEAARARYAVVKADPAKLEANRAAQRAYYHSRKAVCP